MTALSVWYGERRVAIDLSAAKGARCRLVEPAAIAAASVPVATVGAALDEPHGRPGLEEVARGCERVTIVVPDPTRPAATQSCVLPVIARLARAGLQPQQITIVVARGLHPACSKPEVVRLLGPSVMDALRAVQSAPDTPELNVTVGEDPEIGEVRVRRVVAESDLVVLTGAVLPHHLAGFGGGAKAFVPGVAERATILAAHRLTLRACLRPDGSLREVAGSFDDNPFRDALLRVADDFGRCFLLNVVLADGGLAEGGQVAAAAAGAVGPAHAAAVAAWRERSGVPEPEPADLVVAGTREPRSNDLIQAHKTLLAAAAWARPAAPIVWLVPAPMGPGHPDLLPWFEIRRREQHWAALHREFHPYGLTAWSFRRIASEHPVHVVSELSRDVLRPLGLLPFADAKSAIAHALANHDVETAVVLP